MKILFAANRFPYPPFRGDKLKIFQLARRLAGKHEVQLLTFLQDEADRDHLPELQKYFTKIHLVEQRPIRSILLALTAFFRREPFQIRYFRNPKMHKAIQHLLEAENFDVVHVQHLRMAQYWENRQQVPRILDLPDAYSLYWQRRTEAASGLGKWFAAWEQRKVARYEAVLKKFDRVLVCSGEDRRWLEEKQDIGHVELLPNGVDLQQYDGPEHDYRLNRDILFTGNMDYAPNVDAVLYFAGSVLPVVRRVFPELRFVIAGQRPVKKVRALAGKHIVVTGFVEDLKTCYEQAGIVVAPLRFGAGTQNKVLEAMAMGVPVVTGPVGFEGLNIQSGEGAFLAEDAASFAEICIRLLGDAALRARVGRAGQSAIRRQFDWDAIAGRLEQHLYAVGKSPDSPLPGSGTRRS